VKRKANVWFYAALLAGSASVAHAEIKVGVVDVQRLAAESPQAQAAKGNIQTEYAPRYQEMVKQAEALQARQEKLQKDAPTMTQLQRDAAEKELRDGERDLQMKRAAFEDDLEARQQSENANMARLIQEEVGAFARAEGFDLILADGVIFASGAMDVTDALLKSLNSKTGAAAAPARAPAPPASIAKP